MWTLGAYAWLFAGTLLLEALVIPLAGAAVHHGQAGLVPVTLVTMCATVARSILRHRLRRRKATRRLTWFQRVVLPRPSSLLRSLLWVGALLSFGFVAGHVIHGSGNAVRYAFGGVGLVLLGVLVARAFAILPASVMRRIPPIPPGGLLHSAMVGAVASILFLIPWWPPEDTSVERLVAETFRERGLQPRLGTLRFVDEPERGLRNALTNPRALLLAHAENAPPDVYLVQFGFSHDKRPGRITSVYNLSDTASVAEEDLRVWRKWAAWTIRLNERPLSVEVADLRGEAPGRGEGWGRLEQIQRAVTNRQETGQWRGVGRTSVRLLGQPQRLETRLEDGALRLDVDAAHVDLALGRDAHEENQRGVVEVSVVETPIPGDVVTWAVDRLRASPWIGSDGMQWVKGLAFKAADRIETIENDLVGIDVDEAISEELGDVLETLPLAKPGDIPGWPPRPIEPLLTPPLAAEGKWVDMARDVLLGTEDDRGGSPFVFSFIRTDPARTYNQVSVTLWDPRRIELHIVAGTVEPRTMTGELGSGLISRDPKVLERVVGAFNGAFQSVHGEFGMMEDRRVVLPPKPYAATVATLDDDMAGFGTWGPTHDIPKHLVGFRQNMTPLVVDDKVNPYGRHWWGGVPEGWTEETRTVRSGVCYTEEGFIAYFYSPSIDPDRLGAAMRRVRCTYGIHLDMNAGHTGFEFYRVAPKGKLPGLGRPLDRAWEASGEVSGVEGYEFLSRLMVRKMPLMNFPRYIHRSPRDFFYLTRRILLPGPGIAGPAEAPLSVQSWGILAAPHNEWPHAVVVAEVPVQSEPEKPPVVFRLTRIDGKQVEFSPPSEARAHVLSLALPGEAKPDSEGAAAPSPPELVLARGKRGFQVTDTAEKPGGTILSRGSAEATPTTASALCLSQGDLLTLVEASGQPEPASWIAVMDRAGCAERMFFDTAVRVVPAGSEADPRGLPVTVALSKKAFAGARRIFEDTPILPQSKWGIPQAQRVPYVPNPVEASE